MWQPINTAPEDLPLEVAVIDDEDEHTLMFPVRRVGDDWEHAETGRLVSIRPTHWRPWSKDGDE